MVTTDDARNRIHVPLGCVVRHYLFGWDWISLDRLDLIVVCFLLSATFLYTFEGHGQNRITCTAEWPTAAGLTILSTPSTINDRTHIGFYPGILSVLVLYRCFLYSADPE